METNPRNTAWFKSYFGWAGRGSGDRDRRDADRAREGVLAASRSSGDPTPALKRVWRSMLARRPARPTAGED